MCLAWLRGRFWKVLCSREYPVCSACGVQGVVHRRGRKMDSAFILMKTNNKQKTGSLYLVVLTDDFFSVAPTHNFSRKRKV